MGASVVALSSVGAGAMGLELSDHARGLTPWDANTDPTDAARVHVEEVTAARHEYVVVQGGTMDGTNCRSPMGVYESFEQTWESNRAVRLENVGETDVVNPWLSNGRNDFRDIDEIVASAVEPGMSDRERAIAIWYQQTQHRYHWQGGDNEVKTPVKVRNVYGHNTCGDDSNCMAGMWRAAGLRVAPARIMGHCVTQVFYDDAWHLMDADMHSIYLLRDSHTIAGEEDIVRDHDLIKRSHVHGILHLDNRNMDEWEAALYVHDGHTSGERDAVGVYTMDMVLRPGEAITWRWGHTTPIKYHGGDEPKFPDTICNGLWEYAPDFAGDAWRRGTETADGVAAQDGALMAGNGGGCVVWRLEAPYVMVGGRIEAEGDGARFAVSWDGEDWQDAGEDMDALFPPSGSPRYSYYLRCTLQAGARLESLRILNDLQMAPLALPDMMVGENAFAYTDESPGSRSVRVTHEWVERSASVPPEAPAAPIHPPDGGVSDGTDVVFMWEPVASAVIGDYHFELSERADMRWPLSTNFAKFISRTADRGKAQHALPGPGLLAPDTTYYWHVRAKSSQGVWGPWSETWSFTASGPTPPVDVALEFDAARRVGVLRWAPGQQGRRPVSYRVYGSDERGFSVSDEPYEVNVGDQEPKLPTPFPASFVAETEDAELVVLSEGADVPNANRAFYRVVAVDEHGKRSGPSDFVAAPRPFIHSPPVTEAQARQPYSYQVRASRSLGDLRARGGLKMSFWDVEPCRFTIDRGPRWLRVDETTGLLSGTPDAPGKVAVVVTATTEPEVRKLDEQVLSWGREKVIGLVPEYIGSDTQRFIIEVSE